jgi:hypothetical protein
MVIGILCRFYPHQEVRSLPLPWVYIHCLSPFKTNQDQT